jgi:type I restriction enzyme R subunit
MDVVNPDTVTKSDWATDQQAEAEKLIASFTSWLEAHKDEITALQIFYHQPYRRRELTFKMVKDLSAQILRNQPTLAPMKVWEAYKKLGKAEGQPKDELIALVALIRRVTGIDAALTPFDETVKKNFADWVWKKQQGAAVKFTKEQMQWLHLMKEHIATSVHLNTDDLDYTPFDALGGRGKMWQLFGAEMETIIEELNEALVA